MPKLINLNNEQDEDSHGFFYEQMARSAAAGVQRSLNKGININVYHNGEDRPLSTLLKAIRHNNEDAVRLLCAKIKGDQTQILRELLTFESNGRQPIVDAAATGNVNIIKSILSCLVDVNPDYREPALMVAATSFSSRSLILEGLWDKDSDGQFKKQLEDFLYGVGTFPAGDHTVTVTGNLGAVALLGMSGANPEDFDSFGVTTSKLFENILEHAKKGYFKSGDAKDVSFKFHPEQSDKDTLVFTAFVQNNDLELSNNKVKIIFKTEAMVQKIKQLSKDWNAPENEKRRQAFELQRKVKSGMDRLDKVEEVTKANQLEIKRTHELATLTASRVDNIDEALGPKIEINGREQKLLADHVNDHDHVRIFYLSLKLLLRAKLFAGVTLSSDDVNRQKNQKTDYLAQGIQGLSEIVQVPFLSKFVKGIGSGVQYKNDKSELGKNKKLNTNAAVVLDIEDYCRGLALKLTEYCTPTLINFTKNEDAEKLAEEAMKVMIERIKAGHFAQADAKDYLDAFDQVAKAVIHEKKFNELLIRKCYAPIEQKPIQHTPLTPQYSTLSTVDSQVVTRPQVSFNSSANGVANAHGQNTQVQSSHLSQPANQVIAPAIAKPLAAPKPLSKPVSMTPGFAAQAGKSAPISVRAPNGQPLATGGNMKQFIVPVR